MNSNNVLSDLTREKTGFNYIHEESVFINETKWVSRPKRSNLISWYHDIPYNDTEPNATLPA